GWIFTGLVAFAAYKLVTLVGFARLKGRAARESNPPMLLLLRVFALGHRSERFFDAFSKWWRRLGSISLIAGPDLVTTVVEPHEFLDFVSGRLSRQFVQGAADLEHRLANLDRQPDFDGRYRVNEFFCRADTWQMTMRQLAKESDAVLMDLRSFSRSNHGCLYEVEQLLEIVALERVAFLVDKTTDLAFLEEMLQRLWQGVGLESPNRATESPTVRLFHAGDQLGSSIRALLLLLLSTRAPQGLARPCPNNPAHLLDLNWETCPYCEAEKRSRQKSDKPERVAPSRRERTVVGEVPATVERRETKAMLPGAAHESRGRPAGGDTRRIVGALITYTWRPEGQLFPIREGRNFIGRAEIGSEAISRSCDVQISQDQKMSAEHALILCRHGRYEIIDQETTNGTFVNGELLKPKLSTELPNYAAIQTGSTLWTLIKIEALHQAEASSPPKLTPEQPEEKESRGKTIVR
ncbi:MAG TPA: FHA domain-containing protein, partial [Candidatus Binatia bacterium]|nr:FHA domain-containing protein [Candidatus Binatia bacterium]